MPIKDNRGLIDFIDNTIYLNGKAQYMRYPYADDITTLTYSNVYEGKMPDTKTEIKLDNDWLSINLMRVHENTGITSVSNPAEYLTIIEESNTSWVRLSHEKIYSYNIAFLYNLAALKSNMMKRARHEIYPYDSNFISSYITGLDNEELQ